VAGRASPRVGVRREDDVVGIGSVVVQAFPDAARARWMSGAGGSWTCVPPFASRDSRDSESSLITPVDSAHTNFLVSTYIRKYSDVL
jgi:hypothetical protein